MFQPAGDAVLCRCKHVIDMSHGKEVPVEAEPTVTVSGLRYRRGEGGEGGVGGKRFCVFSWLLWSKKKKENALAGVV